MDQANQSEIVGTFASAFAESLAASLTLRQERSWQFKRLEESEAGKAIEQEVNFRLSLSGGMQGVCFVAFDQAQVRAFDAQSLTKSGGSAGGEQGDPLEDALVAAVQGFASTLSVRYGEVTLRVERVDDPSPEGLTTAALAASVEGEGDISIQLRLDQTLLASLTSTGERKVATQDKQPVIEPANLQLVMDVELNVSLRFGQCQLPLRDVLDLNSGSVIELDRDVDDPVELLLDGKVIARGEAVIVDGNYGLRITEIPQPIASHFSNQSFKG